MIVIPTAYQRWGGYEDIAEMSQDSSAIAETLENYFLSGEVDKIEIVYSR